VLARLRPDFPDVSISKIRFLEAEGLVQPERAPSGYRRFTAADVERLRYILEAQRDHYLPLKVIGEHLEAIERGMEPPSVAGGKPQAPESARAVADAVDLVGSAPDAAADLRMSVDELVENSGLSAAQLDALMAFGLVKAVRGTEYFDADALVVATAVARLGEYGLEPRHVRAFKSAADREVGLIEQVARPLARQSDPSAQARADAVVAELTVLCLRLHAALVRSGLHAAD
jgi:DNA-binding transcriptional MerR regulator